MGYFICPLLNVALGVLILRERLRKIQWFSIIIALVGILYMTIVYGKFPWIALGLAGIFAIYGLIRKTTKLEALPGFATEMLFLFIPSLTFILYLVFSGKSMFIHSGLENSLLLWGAGAMSAIPLILFSAAARKIALSTLGILQYILPTMQFLVGVFIYHEKMNLERLIGFLFIWIALVIFTVDAFKSSMKENNTCKCEPAV
jgi:chloramphenicol-sensitive protein RarD